MENSLARMIKQDKSPEFYQNYPSLFSKYFRPINIAHVKLLSKAGYFYYQSILLLDLIVDEKNFSGIKDMISLQEDAIKILYSIYNEKTEFWKAWKKRKAEYFEAIIIEKQLKQKLKVKFSDYIALADKKAAFGKIAIDSLNTLSIQKKRNTYNLLLESHKYFSVGFQLYDDFRDFKHDLDIDQFNWGVYLFKNQHPKKFTNDFEKTHKLFFLTGVGEKLLKKSIENFQKALNIVEKLAIESEWKNVIKESLRKVTVDFDITAHYINSIRKKVYDNKSKDKNVLFFDFDKIENISIKKGLHFVKEQYIKDYPDLKHFMYLGKIDGFDNIDQVHESDIFPRAILNDCFFSISNKYDLNILDFMNSECSYFIELRNKDAIGGWSYFPTASEVAADIDDLGQILQLFINANKPEFIELYCEKAIQTALRNRYHANGGIETWIIPKYRKTNVQKKQEFFNHTRWGKGPDIEVVSNFLYGLLICDKNLISKKQIEKSLSYIISCQNSKGFWESIWYYGNYYGTYVSLRLLKLFEKEYAEVINKATNYIIRTQNKDGGFSLSNGKPSDPLSTSFALLSLKLFFEESKSSSILNTKRYLISKQEKDGSWSSTNFIKPKFLKPYKSKTLTTGLVLKALSE